MNEVIPAALDGERVDRVVAMLADVSRSAAAAAIGSGLVSVDGKVVESRSTRVHADQVVEIDDEVRPGPEVVEADPTVELDIVHVDEDVIVIDKRPGQVVHPGAGNRHGTVAQGVLALYPEVADVGEPSRPGIVHRLDKGTSGVFAVARSPAGYRSLCDQLSERSIGRRYLALVWGHPASSDGLVDAPIGRAVRDPTRMTIREDGREARTSYSVKATWTDPEVALVACELETGRTHQIRVHMAAIGHPVVGDERYGGHRSGIDIDRPVLHAARLTLTHPATGRRMTFESPLPPDVSGVLDVMGPPSTGSITGL